VLPPDVQVERRSSTQSRSWRGFGANVSSLTAANVLGALASVVQGVVVARWLGPEAYGVAALIISYPTLLQTVFEFRSNEAGIKYLGEFIARRERDQALAMCRLGYFIDVGVSLLAFAVAGVTAAWAAARIVHVPGTAGLIWLYAAALVPSALTITSRAVLAVTGHFAGLARAEALISLLRLSLVLIFVAFGHGVAGVVWGNAIATTMHGLILGTLAHATSKADWGGSWLSASVRPLRERRREIGRFLVFTNIDTLLGVVTKQVDLLLLGALWGPAEAGFYRLAKSIVAVPDYVAGPLGLVSFARLAREWGKGQWREMWAFVRSSTFRVGLPLALLIIAAIPFIPGPILRLAGASYAPAVPMTQILLLRSAASVGLFGFSSMILAWGHAGVRAIAKGGVAALMLLGFVFVVPSHGGLGAAAVTAGASVVAALFACVWVLTWGRRAALAELVRRGGHPSAAATV
jgi:O-antigen/teichoic acid export membrane protein